MHRKNKDFPVYYLVASLNFNDSKSIENIRFVRNGVDKARINFPSITDFPLQKGKETSVFSCFHNSGSLPVLQNGKLELNLYDRAGNIIHSAKYEGMITSSMMGYVDKFVPESNYDYLYLEAKLFQNDKQIDQAKITYDCQKINPLHCSSSVVGNQISDLSNRFNSSNYLQKFYIIASVVAFLVLLVGSFLIYRKKGGL